MIEAPASRLVSPPISMEHHSEVLNSPTRDSGNRYTVASVLSPEAPSETATRISHIINTENISHAEGKDIIQPGISAADEALSKAIKNVLSASIAREPTNQETTRNVLPNGRPSLLDSSHGKAHLSVSSNVQGFAVVKAPSSSLSNIEIDASHAQGKVVEAIVKAVREFGYAPKADLNKSSSLRPKVLNAGTVAGKKSDKQVTCVVCSSFRGRPCELK